MADRVYASMDAVQAAGKDAIVHCAGCEPEDSQLVQGYDPMLASGECGRPPVRWAEFPTHMR